MTIKKNIHAQLPASTKAYICAICGAVSLSSDGVCKVQGMGTKADWCGIEHTSPVGKCKHDKHNKRYKCTKCGQVSVNPELLCEPEKMSLEQRL